MATRQQQPADPAQVLRLSPQSIKTIETYLVMLLEYNKKSDDLRNKLEAVDIAYARYQVAVQNGQSGQDVQVVANTQVGVTEPEITVPLVISQVDSHVGYLADVYLSGYPMFPVVSTPKDMKDAEMLEAIIDNHAMLGMYPKHLLMSFRDGIKYNFMPIEHSWEPVDVYSPVTNYLRPTQASQMNQSTQFYTAIRRLDPYNVIFDRRVAPSELCYKGDFAGYLQIVTRVSLKSFINRYSKSGYLYNVGEISNIQNVKPSNYYYTDLPTITNMLKAPRRAGADFDWSQWLAATPQKENKRPLQAGTYERFTCYARIIPSDYGMNVPQPNTPQIWKFVMINSSKLLYAQRIYSIYDTLPIIIGQPLEDGFELQTQSIGEAQIDMQDAASTLFNIRFNAARRAVSDRALYDPTLINSSDVNTKEPAPKIPVRLSGLNDKGFESAYHQIPYDASGTDSVIGDVRNVFDLSDRLSGLNNPQQGRFQKGNKSVVEWQDTMSFADNRPRLPALTIEYQVMMPIKQQIKLNIYQNGVQGNFQDFRSGNVYEVKAEDINRLKEKVLNFKLADGYTPKSKLASTEFLGKLVDTIAQSQLLQQAWGIALPKMFAHLASLGGVKGLDQYLPEQVTQQQPTQGPSPNGPANNQQTPPTA